MDRITTIPMFIEALGGDNAVGKLLGLTYKAIAQWRVRNHIACSYHLKLLVIARKRGINVSPLVFGLDESDVGELFHVAPISSATHIHAAA